MEWKEVRLGDVCNIITGFPFPGKKYSQKGVRVVRGDNVTIGNLRWDTEKDKRWNEPFDKTEYYSLQANDIVIGMDGSRVGKNKARIKEEDLPLLLAQRVACVRHNELAEQDYLYYNIFSKKFVDYVNSIHTGSAIPHISQKQIEDYKILLPNLETQHCIASILSSLDRKIELNNKINADLEEMAQAIFKNWFVDFEPFKDGKFVDSELGMIPEGWKVGRLKDLLYLRKDSIKAANKGNLPYLPIDTIPMHCLVATDFKSNDEAKSSLQTFEQNDIVVGAMRVYFHRVILAPCKGITRTTCFVLSVKNENALAYSLMQCNQDEAISFAEKTSKGSTMPYAVWDGGYGEYKVVIPPSEVMKSFNDLLSNFFSKMNKNAIENSRLSLLRDTLLPRLMSGELEVPE